MIPVPEVSRVDIAFPARGGEIAPPYEEIPESYREGGTKGNRFFRHWFAGIVDWPLVGLLPREGVDAQAAFNALKVVAGTYAIKHEHKEAAMAYLLDEWFVDFRWTTVNGQHHRFEDEAFDAEWLERQK